MARVILVTGGARSGKSSHAQKLAESLPGLRLFVATCPPCDDEMRQRIRIHQNRRSARGWDTVEETTDLLRVLKETTRHKVLLLDCLTLWISNLLLEGRQKGAELTENAIEQRCRELLEACAGREGTVIFVTNEVGAGIVPDNALARRFRDLSGRCNQVMAAGADVVVFLVCGIPTYLKGGGTCPGC